MSTLVLTRESNLVGIIRNIEVILDNQTIGEISNGEKKEFSINTGTHVLRLKMDWCSSNEVLLTLNDEDIVNFNCGISPKNPFSNIYMSIFNTKQYLYIR